MKLTPPYPSDLLRVARKVVWYDKPEETLADLMTFLSHLMVYGSPSDILLAERYVSADEFRKVLEDALLACLRRRFGRGGMRGSEYPRRLYHGVGFLMVRLVLKLGVFFAGSCGDRIITLHCWAKVRIGCVSH
jgi:hypothetical protein